MYVDLGVWISQIIANICVAAAAIIAIRQLRQDRLVAKMDMELRIKEQTIRFAHQIMTETSKVSAEIRKAFQDGPIDVMAPENEVIRREISRYLRLMERLSVGVNTGIYDLDIYARMYRSRTILMWDRLELAVEQIRANTPGFVPYEEFELLVKQLKAWEPGPGEKSGDFQKLI